MKVLVSKETGVVVFAAPDYVPVVIRDDVTRVGNPENPLHNGYDYYVCGCNTETVELHENVTVPDGWMPDKFLFDGTTWSSNPDWVDLTPPPAPEPAPAPAQG